MPPPCNQNARRARAHERRWGRWCRTDSSPREPTPHEQTLRHTFSLERSLKREDLPTLGTPTIPMRTLLPTPHQTRRTATRSSQDRNRFFHFLFLTHCNTNKLSRLNSCAPFPLHDCARSVIFANQAFLTARIPVCLQRVRVPSHSIISEYLIRKSGDCMVS